MRERELTNEEKGDTADVLIQRTNALWDAEDQIVALRRDLAAARERVGRLRGAMEQIEDLTEEDAIFDIAVVALAEPATDAGEAPDV